MSDGPVPVTEVYHSNAAEPESTEPDAPEREFEVDGKWWRVRLDGEGVAGTGRVGGAALVALHFRPEDEPRAVPLEVLVPRGRFHDLFDAELRELLRSAKPADRT